MFDCNILLQGLASPDGPSGRCVQLAIDGKIQFLTSPAMLDELREVASRPKVIRKFRLTPKRAEEFFSAIEICATIVEDFASAFAYARDPDDAQYVNLALAAGAPFIVSRDRDLLDLMDSTRTEAIAFQSRFPAIQILDPIEFLREAGRNR